MARERRALGIADRLFAAVERLPGPPLVFYALAGGAIAGTAQAVLWASGEYPANTLEPEVLQPPLLAAFLLGLTHLLRRVAASAFEDFLPALAGSPDTEAYRRALTALPDRAAASGVAIAIVVVLGGFMLFVRPYLDRPAIVDMLAAPLWIVTAAAAGIFIAQDVRQLRAIGRLSRAAPSIDIFDSTATNAFSRLTAVSSVTILLMVAFFVLTERDVPVAYIGMLAALAAVAIATFVLPLRAMHERLENEKQRLMNGSTERLKSVMGHLDAAVRQGDLSRADQLDKMLSAVLAERDVLARLHTWPWSETTFRGFASALLLPIVIFLITRTIERVL